MDTELPAAPSLVAGDAHERAARRVVLRRRLALVGGAVTLLAVGVGAVSVVLAGVRPAAPTPRATDVDPAVAATGAVLDRWYSTELPALDLDWEPVGARLTDGDGSVVCDGVPLVLDELLRENAFATTCREGPAVAFDPGRFAADDVATQVVLAHEWGHVVQIHNLATVDLPTRDPSSSPAERELQADCFAGAWAAEHVVGEFHGLMLADIGSFGDPASLPFGHEHGHGTAQERRIAYELGAAGGLAACLPPGFDPR